MTIGRELRADGGGTVVALVGAGGMLARAIRRTAPAGWSVVPLDLPEFDVTDEDRVRTALDDIGPRIIINCAADTDVDGCETRERAATAVNGTGVAHLAAAAKRLAAILVHVSTDFVFDGRRSTPYAEDHPAAPLSAYGRSKLAGERALLASGLREFFLVRTGWLYGEGGTGFVDTIARLALERTELRVVSDQFGCPTFTDDLAHAVSRLLALADRAGAADRTSRSCFGIYHFVNRGVCSRHELASRIVEHLRALRPVATRSVVPVRTEEMPRPARRPPYSALSTAKYEAATGAAVAPWEDALRRFFESRASVASSDSRGVR